MSLLSLVNIGNIVFIATLIAVSYFKNIFVKIALIFIATLLVKFRFGFDPSNIAFLTALFFGVLLQENLPFSRAINIFISVIISFFAFNVYIFLA